jgi:hypothetical protein
MNKTNEKKKLESLSKETESLRKKYNIFLKNCFKNPKRKS